LQCPVWSGPWPELDFHSSRILQPDEAGPLDTSVYRPDIELAPGGYPDEIKVELTDATRGWFARRVVAVTSRN